MPRLPLTVPLAWRETAPSYTSRLAARNGVGASDFCRDFGTSFRAVVDGDPVALEIIAELGGIKPDRLGEWSAVAVGRGTHRFRGYWFPAGALHRPEIRGCTDCLREDAENSDLPPHQAMAIRTHWQLSHVAICLRHRRYLVPLYRETNPLQRYDTCGQLETIADEILAGARDGRTRRPFGFDEWLDDRLETGPGEDWLSGHPLHAAATFCLLLGSALLRLEGRAPYQIPETQRDLLREMGYQIARHGEDGVRDALDRIQACAKGPQDGPKKTFPLLYDRLAHEHADDPDYAPYLKILRDHMIARWPLGPGDDLLGEPVMERRLHSVLTASRATGVDPRRLRKMLAAEGLVSEDDYLPDAWAIFDARAAEPLLGRLTQRVPATEFARSIGATRSQFDLLVSDGILASATEAGDTYAVWNPRDGEMFLSRLLAGAIQLRQAQHDWTHISSSAQRLRSDRARSSRRSWRAAFAGSAISRDARVMPPSMSTIRKWPGSCDRRNRRRTRSSSSRRRSASVSRQACAG